LKNQNKLKFGQSFNSILITIIVLFFLVCMIAKPAKFIKQSLEGIYAWAFNVLPSVLPFMFFTKVLSSLNVISKFTRPFSPLSSTLFKTPPISIYAFTMAILSGYPVGSKMVADLYLQGQITKQDAFRMSSFCSTSGPMFIVGAVGVGMFHNSQIGYILFISHILGAILNGMLYRNLNCKDNEQTKENNIKNEQKPTSLAEIVQNSTLSILAVGTLITIFFIVIECFSPILNLLPQNIAFFLEGVIEITKGCIDLSTLSNLKLSVLLCSFVISFGGISTILQSITMLNSLKMPVKLFILQKLTHAVFATLTTLLLLFLL